MAQIDQQVFVFHKYIMYNVPSIKHASGSINSSSSKSMDSLLSHTEPKSTVLPSDELDCLSSSTFCKNNQKGHKYNIFEQGQM